MKVKQVIEFLSKLDENTTIDESGVEINGNKFFALPQTSAAIVWSVEDFEDRARDKAEDEWEDVYDQTKFCDALHKMIQKHDAGNGISWATIDDYLFEECRKKIE